MKVASIAGVSSLLAGTTDAMVMPLGVQPAVRGKRSNPLPREVSQIIPAADDRPRLEDAYYESIDDIGFEVNAFQELQKSINSDILDDDLQTQIDQASQYPERFLDAHMKDASHLEKVAMSSIPQQLPRPAVKALSNNRSRKNSGSKKKASQQPGLKFSAARVTPEEEIELGKMIQKGVKLHKVRAEFEDEHGRKPTKNEWSQAAGLGSVGALRKEVANYRRAKQLLVSANIGLVHAVIKPQYQSLRRQAGLTYDEFIQEGSLGLIRAAELFDPGRGLRFSTYATIWIKGSLSNSHVQEQIRLPLRERAKFNKIRKAHNDLAESRGGDEPSIEEVAEVLGMSVSDVVETQRRFKSTQQVLSLDYEYSSVSRGGGETSVFHGKLDGDKNFQADADLAQRAQIHADVVAAMARNLNAREARLMRLRYGLADGRTRTLRECAEAMGLSQTRTQNIASRCLKKLREAEEASCLEEYFLTIA